MSGDLWEPGGSGGAATLPAGGGAFLATPMYWFYELGHAALNPSRAFGDATRLFFKNPVNPLGAHRRTENRSRRQRNCSSARLAATASRFGVSIPPPSVARSRLGQRQDASGTVRSAVCSISSARSRPAAPAAPKLLIVAPMSGHYATLLRGTVEALLPNHDVYITDWVDARMVPVAEGRFDLDDYIDYVIDMLHGSAPTPMSWPSASLRCRCLRRSR